MNDSVCLRRDSGAASGAGDRRYFRVAVVSFSGNAIQRVAAGRLDDLRAPPGNRLEALKGDRKGQMSIRINDQWRVCFRWTEAGPADVEIVDYH